MVRIRLRRVGGKKQPTYRIVVTDRRNPRDGRFIEKIGFYNPRTEPSTVEVDEERALYWLDKGAQPSDAVHRLLKNLGTMERYERLRAGESLETLLADAEAAAAARPLVDPRTRRDEMVAAKTSKRAKAKAEATAVAEAEAVLTEPEAEAAEEEPEEVAAAEAEMVEETTDETAAAVEEAAVSESEVADEEAGEEAADEPEEAEADAEPEAEEADEEPAEGDE